jgi:hypothetical protein
MLAGTNSLKRLIPPDGFVADKSDEQMLKEAKAFCDEIGSTLRALRNAHLGPTKPSFILDY